LPCNKIGFMTTIVLGHQIGRNCALTDDLRAGLIELARKYADSDQTEPFVSNAEKLTYFKIDGVVRGVVEFTIVGTTCTVNWFCAPGYGKIFAALFEAELLELKISTVRARIVLSRDERESTLTKRLNFVNKAGFKCVGVSFDDPARVVMDMIAEIGQ